MKFLGKADALEGGEQVVEDHVEAQPGGVGAKLLTGQGGDGEFVHEQVMGVVDGTGLVPVAADQREAAAGLGVGTVGDNAEMAHPIAVAQQFALAWADADGEIAARRDGVLLPNAVAGQVIDLGPLADRIGLRLVSLPVIREWAEVNYRSEEHTSELQSHLNL